MKEDYQLWIDELSSTDVTGNCKEVSEQMAERFPELRRVRGHYYCWIWGEREHWWLMDGDEVVDPTASQFPSDGAGRYEEWMEGAPEPVGKCMECGQYSYDDPMFCSTSCRVAYVGSLV